MVHIVGAGPGAADLITVRGQKLLREADVIIYAGSLVSREVLGWAKQEAILFDSAFMTLEQVMEVIADSEKKGLMTVRLHTGDPSLYGAVREQMDWMDREGISFEICPGVSSFCGAASALSMEYTLPGVSQSLIITRIEGRTPVPEGESLKSFASHRASMVLFLSAGMLKKVSEELLAGGYKEDTPAAIVYKATWPDQKILRCSVGTLQKAGDEAGISKTALILVGDAVAQAGYERSKLYDPSFTTAFRKGGLEDGEKEQETKGENREENKKRGRLRVVGMGPGSLEQMTDQAKSALSKSQVIAGYKVYVELVREYFPHKEFLMTGMTKEEERCRMAFLSCMEGKDTAMICSGDSGVYGMAGLILEMAQEYPDIEVEIISGVTAACAGAAVLGAPLMHDFAVISLSDRLTPIETIWKRVEQAAQADFVICIYNPSSKGRPDYLAQACRRILKYRSGDTVCGAVMQIGRSGQEQRILSLSELSGFPADMFTTIYIGNSSTKKIGNYMVTPRGYRYEQK